MNLNKCERCGCFFASKDCVCPNCRAKDENDINQLKNFLTDSDNSVSVETLSSETGVSLKNVNRYLQDKDLYLTLTNLGLNSSSDFPNINLF
jgi:hypothetical protein